NGLNINSDDVRCKWSIRQSTKTLIVKQYISGSYREKDITTTSRDTVTQYPYPQHDPLYRLLPYVKKSAKNLISLNVKTPDILAQNARIIRNVFENRTLIGNFRTLLTAMDITNIKKQMLRNKWNIDIKHDAAKNLDQILGPKADPSELKDACLHYQPHTKDNDRLEIIICTREQQDYVWKYGHQNLILIDGTFGISKHKLLLFIIMIIDDNNKGVPVSFILFTPPRSNRLTSSGYDSKILERLFTIFHDKISDNYNQNQSLATSVTFSPCAAMTDADIKERKPLTKVWPGIILLLCYFHISQCCKNEMNKQLGCGGGNKIILLQKTLKTFLKSVLDKAWLMNGSKEMVCNYITKKKESLECIYKAESMSENKKILEGGLNFLSYLKKQWGGDLLSSWCLSGWINAAKALGIPLEKLPTTNNHLEGMNEYLKNNQLNRFQRNNQLLRADVLYIALVYEVIPNILKLRNLAINIEREKAERRKDLNIMDPSDHKVIMQEFFQVAYLSLSVKRDKLARKLIDMNKIVKYEVEKLSGKIYVEVESETMPGLIYTTCVYGQPTDICYQCLDFLQSGVMCKHL
ncbi:13971_t:CDS:2, partial [Cetraspora pellucida]